MPRTSLRPSPWFVGLLLLVVASSNLGANPTSLDDCPAGWEAWRQGEVRKAHALSLQFLEEDSTNEDATGLLVLTTFVIGDYESSLKAFQSLPPDSRMHLEFQNLALDALTHLHRFDEAYRLAEEWKRPEPRARWYATRRDQPMTVDLEGLTTLPFVEGDFMGDLMPAIPIELNGEEHVAHLDTGGAFIAMSPKMAERLNIDTFETGAGYANARQTSIHRGIAESLVLGDAELTNVPVSVLSALTGNGIENMIILGTNILQPFLTTWDNGAGHLLLSKRGDEEGRAEHRSRISPEAEAMDFYLYSDHYLFAQGSVGDHRATFFVDTGLAVADPMGIQPALSIASSVLREWGVPREKLEGQTFIESPWPIALGPIARPGHTMMVSGPGASLSWHGLTTDALLCHGFTKHCIWTLDFDERKWYLQAIDDQD